jgi:aryl-alcohol dehydrogenase-like predicted oxidoreductase
MSPDTSSYGMSNDIRTRPFGTTGIAVSEIGLGCNRIGESFNTESEWIALLELAVDLGVTVFDTATVYGKGRSQELVGKALGNRRDVVVATKVSPIDGPEGRQFTYNSVIEGAENCLRLLRRDAIDILQTHGGGSLEEVSNPELIRAFEDLKKSGKIRARASATFNAEGARYAIENGLVEGLQITYNLIDRSHALPILDLAAERGVGLLARMPYQRGTLTGKFVPDREVPEGHRARLQGERLADDIARAEAFRELSRKRPGGMAELAMQYVLHDSRLSTTIPGARNKDQLRRNIAHATADPLTAEELARIEENQQGWK